MRALLVLLSILTLSDYTGRYQQSDGKVVYVFTRGDTLVVRPVFWRATQDLAGDAADRFHSLERPERKAVFTRDASGRVVSLTMNGIGDDAPMPRLQDGTITASELLMDGRVREASRALLRRKDAADVAVAWGEFIARALPTQAVHGASFVGWIAERYPANARLREVHGDLLVAAGKRAQARKEYAAARTENAARALRMLKRDDLGALFARPTKAELDAVRSMWAKRDLAPRDVTIVHRGTLGDAEVRIVSHRVHGFLHYGAVIVPRGAKDLPVIAEAKGVSPSYFPLDLAQTPTAPAILGDAFIYVLPSYRGETLLFDGHSWTSEGDRTDVWDGATDDFIAFTHAALTVTREADASRVCAFGRSRGGTVALLAGIRDRLFARAVAWSAPTDHFFAMVQSGWTPRERVAEGLRAKSDVFGIGGQFIETFLSKPRSVAETRLHLIASSPLWFAEELPPTQAHYGLDDNIVSVRNGRALLARNPKIELVIHDRAGHDLDKPRAWDETRRFLVGVRWR